MDIRNLKIGEMNLRERWLPFIRIQGLWLQKAGFQPGERVVVKVQPGKIEIVLESHKEG